MNITEQDFENQLVQAIGYNTFIAILNQKFLQYIDNEPKSEVITEILNDLKLHLMPTTNKEMH